MLANSENSDQTPLYVAPDLGLHCLYVPHKKDTMFILVKIMFHNPYAVCIIKKDRLNEAGFFTTLTSNSTKYFEISRNVQGLDWCRWYNIVITRVSTFTQDNSLA